MKPIHNNVGPCLFLSLLLVSAIACKTQNNNNETKIDEPQPTPPFFQKMVGLWKNVKSGDFERWVAKENGTFLFDGFSIKGNDTTWAEHGNVYQENGKWISENTVQGQNGGKSTRFAASLLTEDRVVFSNPDHDFPTDICYTWNDADNVSGFICGPNDRNGKDTFSFQYKRVQ